MSLLFILSAFLAIATIALAWSVLALVSARSRLASLGRIEADLQSANAALAQCQKERGERQVEVGQLQVRLVEQDKSLQEERKRAAEQVQEQKQKLSELAAQLESERRQVAQLNVEQATLRAERHAALDQLGRYQQSEKERAELVRAEIENLSHKIFEEKAGKFKELGTTAIADLVGPVREHLEKLQRALTESETKDAVREQSLKEALERVGQINAKLGLQADSLAKALRSDNKMVGDFGEEILERLLEYSGLQPGINYIKQGVDLDLKSDTGGRLLPDVVIFLPENRCLVVDSKMSLKSWTDAQTDDETLRATALEDFRRSVRLHIENLASKPYTESLQSSGRGVVDFKFLFIPIESAFHAILHLDRNLYQYAFDKKIILVSPTTLLAVLTTVNHTWKQFEIGKNAEQIRDRASLLLNKLLDFTTSIEKVGQHLDSAKSAFEEARSRLYTGRGHLVGQAEKLMALGVKTDKSVPRALLELANTDEEEV